MKDLREKILKNSTLTAPKELAILQHLVNMEAQTIVCKLEGRFEGYSVPVDVDKLQDYWIYKDIWSVCTTDQQLKVYCVATETSAMKKQRVKHIIQEYIHNLKVKIFEMSNSASLVLSN